MQRRAPIKDAGAEHRLFMNRLLLASLLVVLLIGLVVGRLIQLQIIEHDHFADLSQGNRVRIEPVPPTRGLIYDRQGIILAENVPTYQLELVPEQVDDTDATLQALIAEGLVGEDELPRIRMMLDNSQRFTPVPLRYRLEEPELAQFAIARPRFPGVDIQARLIRHYPFDSAAVHAIGYVGGLSRDELDQMEDTAAYAGTTQIGKTGIEQQFEQLLHGDVGHRQVIVNARGRTLGHVPGEEPRPGHNVYVSLDIELQLVAEEALAGRRGAVVALDPRNGEVLALVSTPGYDPNAFAAGMKPKEFRALSTDRDQPLFNRAVRGRYPPGSTIKPMLGFAALEEGISGLNHNLFCRGHFSLPGSSHRYRDWKPQGHGLMNLHDAITQSCDVYFYQMSTEMGIDTMHDYLTGFGLGSRTGIDIPGETAGVVPSRAWKKEKFSSRANQVWFPGETVIASIGQGYMLTTPLQLAAATAAVASRGVRFRPHLALGYEDSLEGTFHRYEPDALTPVAADDPIHWEVIINAMRDVMQGESGTARAVGMNAPYSMAGKSGTAQVFSVGQDEEYNEDEIDERLRDHALFVAFAPVEAPRIAVSVIVENGSSGSRTAAPIARVVMDKWLLEDRGGSVVDDWPERHPDPSRLARNASGIAAAD
ncbi:MAG: penicillin-binding protein 2 [Gammaproteobacteria bacterium]